MVIPPAQRGAERSRPLRADAERNRVFAEAYGSDADFFAFYRSLTAYERSLKGKNSAMVMSPDSEFFNYLKGSGVAQ